MAKIFRMIVFVLMSACIGSSIAAVGIIISPFHYTEDNAPEPVKIACVPNLTGPVIKTDFLLQLERHAKPFVSIRKGFGVSYSTTTDVDRNKFKAEGHMSATTGQRQFLTLSIMDPANEDSGVYGCRQFYTDEQGFVKVQGQSANLTVERRDIRDVVKDLQDQVTRLEQQLQLQASKDSVAQIADAVSQLNGATNNQSKQISQLAAKEEYRTAFSAVVTKNAILANGLVIVFPKVIMMEGQGYDNMTGIFTAPRAGLYVFNLALMSECVACGGGVYLKANDKVLANLFAKVASKTHTSANVMAPLQVGDQVKAVVYGGTSLYLADFSMFGGYILKAF